MSTQIKRMQAHKAMYTSNVCVTLDGLCVDHLSSKDLGNKEREGVVVVTIGGQATTLSWATDSDGKLKNEGKFRQQVLYVGGRDGAIDAELTVLETDQAEFAEFQKRTEAVIGFAKAISVFAPPYSPAVVAAGDFANSLLGLYANSVDDDLELSFYGSLLDPDAATSDLEEQGLLSRVEISRRLPVSNTIAVSCAVSVWSLPAPETAKSVAVMAKSLSIEPEFPSSAKWLLFQKKNRRETTVLFETTFGSGTQKRTLKFDCPLDRSLHPLVDGRVLYSGKCGGYVPFYVNAVALSKKDRVDLAQAVSAAAPLIEQIAKLRGTPATEVAADKATLENACKALQSLESLAAEFLPTKMTIGTLSGVLILDESASDSDEQGAGRRLVAHGRPLRIRAGSEGGGCVALDVAIQDPIPSPEPAGQ